MIVMAILKRDLSEVGKEIKKLESKMEKLLKAYGKPKRGEVRSRGI
jgi:hypothetical protein